MAQRLHRGQGMTRALGLVAAILLLLPALPPLAVSAQGDCVPSAAELLQRNLLVYGLGGIVVPFIGIKLVDLFVAGLGLA